MPMEKLNKKSISMIYEKVLRYNWKVKIINNEWYIIKPPTNQRFKYNGNTFVGKVRFDDCFRAYGSALELMKQNNKQFYVWNCDICNGAHISIKSCSGRIKVEPL